jgi:hypothetical protein
VRFGIEFKDEVPRIPGDIGSTKRITTPDRGKGRGNGRDRKEGKK